MIRPASFRKNEETAVNNGYQQDADSGEDTVDLARREFDGLVDALRAEDIDVAVYEDDPKPTLPTPCSPTIGSASMPMAGWDSTPCLP